MVKKLIKKKKKKVPLWTKVVLFLITLVILDLTWYMFILDVKQYEKKNPVKTAFMKYREHQWQSKGRKIKVKQEWVPLSKISPNIRKAVIVAEDAKFWIHDGFDFDAMRKAFETNLKKRKMAVGASTITMQLAKNMFLSPSKNPIRKIHEAILTWRIEKTLTKNRIIELYLNVAEWGDGIFGIETASKTYYNHPASELTRGEAVRLAAVLPNPIVFNPLKNSRFVSRRSRLINRAMGGDVNAAIALHSKDSETSVANVKVDSSTISDTVNDEHGIDNDSNNSLIDSSQIKHAADSIVTPLVPTPVETTE